MTSSNHSNFGYMRMAKQQGLVLFVALIALVVMSLAGVALIRSVDTNIMIAGNLASKQAATTSADAGVEAAISWLMTRELANSAKNVLTDPSHPFNVTAETSGYYSNADSAIDLFDDDVWDTIAAVTAVPASSQNNVTDGSGNTISYVIQRMCRNANLPVKDADCLFSDAVEDKDGQQVKLYSDICEGDGCPALGQTPQIRVTVRVTGPKNTVSYVQAFVY